MEDISLADGRFLSVFVLLFNFMILHAHCCILSDPGGNRYQKKFMNQKEMICKAS